jgi:hypothetical protein
MAIPLPGPEFDHAGHQPDARWYCPTCTVSWPCPPVRAGFLADLDAGRVSLISLGLQMGSCLVQAAERTAVKGEPGLYNQFIGWLREARRR